MSATNLTKNLKLPQFVASDKPSWLGDVNGAMLNIDNGIGTIKSDITKANDTASSAKSQSDANTVTLGNVNTELESIGNRVTALEAGGGTEQLEQKVNTNTSDIEALQTRADTFEEEIADNGSKISTNTKSIDELTSRVKICEDNVTSLTNTVNGHSQTIQDITGNVSALDSVANRADTNATSALRVATNANNTANNNSNAITTLQNKVSNITPTSVYPISFSNTSSNFTYSSVGTCILNKESGFFFIFLPLRINNTVTVSTTAINIGTIDLSSIAPDSMGKNLAFNDITITINSFEYIIGAIKNTDEQTITLTFRKVSGSANVSKTNDIMINTWFNLY